MSKFNIDTKSASIGLNISADPISLKEGEYTFSLNGIVHGSDGNAPFMRMMPGNVLIAQLPAGNLPVEQYHCNQKEICIYSVNPATGYCEIGLFDGTLYKTVTGSNDLGFDIRTQIQSVVDEDFNGHRLVMWVQKGAPIRKMDLNNPPLVNGLLDIDALNVFSKYTAPEIRFDEVSNNGRLPACSLYVTIQYADENGNGLTSWVTPKGPVFIYKDAISQPKNFINGSPNGELTSKSLNITVNNLDQSFKYYNIGVIKSFNGVKDAFIVQTLPVIQESYLYTGIKETERAIDIKDIITPAVAYASAGTINRSNGSVLIGNLKGHKEYNLQPYVNKIEMLWQTEKIKYEKSENTYANPLSGTYNMCLRRNEVYTFGLVIKWNNGTVSRTYPLVARRRNRHANGNLIGLRLDQYGRAIDANKWDTHKFTPSDDIHEIGSIPDRWKIGNTAFVTGTDLTGIEGPAEYGEFGYWESTDRYPNQPLIWGANANKRIRHFMAPDVTIAPLSDGLNALNTDTAVSYIYRLGMRFSNIQAVINSFPVEVRERMQGWEIVRGDRKTSKSIIASGLLFNMRTQNWKESKTVTYNLFSGPFNLPPKGEDDIRLFQNYPFNDLTPDPSIKQTATNTTVELPEHTSYRKDIFSFLSPDTEFDKTMLISGDLQIHTENYGVAKNTFHLVEPYPNLKNSTQDDVYAKIMYHMISIGYYNNYKLTAPGTIRRKLNEAVYIPFNAQVSAGNTGLVMHNLMQEHTVLLQTNKDILNTSIADNSRSIISNPDFNCGNNGATQRRVISSYYCSIVARIQNQYGGVFDTVYVSTNLDHTNVKDNIPVFGGDTFMGLFGTKRQFCYYQNAQSFVSFPDGSRGIDLKSSATIAGTVYNYTSVPKWIADNSTSECEPRGLAGLVPLIQTGVPLFFTESDHNIDLQLNGEGPAETFYPNLKDGSLTVQKWAGISFLNKPNEHRVNRSYEETNDLFKYENPDPFYNPLIADVTNYSTRVIFSLTNSAENRFNNLLTFLPLNYFDFRRDMGELWDIREITNSRLLFRFEHGLFMDRKYTTIPVEQNKIQLGTGKLFETEPVQIQKDDIGYMGTRSQWAFNSTPFGSFMIDSLRGCIIQFREGPADISAKNMDVYFNKELPLKLKEQLPWFKEFDNPANPEGIGYTSVYDHFNKLWILTKRDYEIIDYTTVNNFSYDNDGRITFNNVPVSLSDSRYFANKSMTICYSPLTETWISWLSFMPPAYAVLRKDYFSFDGSEIWKHNEGLPLHFYGKKHPFIFEGVISFANGDSMMHSCSWITRAFPIVNGIQQGESFKHTFNKANFYNLHQHSGNVKLTVQDESNLSTLFDPEQVTATYREKYLRRRERYWQVAQIYDMMIDHNAQMFTTEFAKIKALYYIDKIVNDVNFDYYKSFVDLTPLNDLWVKYRLTYDKDEEVMMYIYLASVLNEQVVV